jgi:hypothetical protein
MAAVGEGRRLILDVTDLCDGNIELITKTLGIRKRNINMHLKYTGLTYELIVQIVQKRRSSRCQTSKRLQLL